LRATDAAGERPPDAARQGRRPARLVCGQPGQDGGAVRDVEVFVKWHAPLSRVPAHGHKTRCTVSIPAMIPRDNPIPALLGFLDAWGPELSPKHRIAASSIPAFVPPPLRSIYELAGNWPIPHTEQCRPPRWVPGLFGTQDLLLPLDQLAANGSRFTFIHE